MRFSFLVMFGDRFRTWFQGLRCYLYTGTTRRYSIGLVPFVSERRQLLLEKLEEYREREYLQLLRRQKASDTIMKRVITERLLERGRVVSTELAKELASKMGRDYSSSEYMMAFYVIDDYVRTGGRNLGKDFGNGIVVPLKR